MLFLKKVIPNLYLKPYAIEQINCIYENNKNIFNSSLILKANKALSYLTFILKEIHEFINIRIHESTYLMEVRMLLRELELFKEKSILVKVKL